MEIRTSELKIWWTDNTPNYPTYRYFQNIKRGMQYNPTLRVEQKSVDTIEVLVETPQITYIWINNMDFDFYYYYNRIIKILPNAYLVEFKLDIFTTFTLPYYNYLEKNRIQVRLNRHHKLLKESLLFKDVMMDNVDIQYPEHNHGMFLNNEFRVRENPPQANLKYELSITTEAGKYYSVGDYNSRLNPVMFYVFRTEDINAPLIAIPALCINVEGDWIRYDGNDRVEIIKNYRMVNISACGTPPKTQEQIAGIPHEVFPHTSGVCNGVNILNELANSKEYANKFVGVYVFPSFLHEVRKINCGYKQFKWVRAGDNKKPVQANMFCIILRTHGMRLGDFNLGVWKGDFIDFENIERKPTLNYSDKMHYLTAHKIELKVMNTEIPFNRFAFEKIQSGSNTHWKVILKNAYFNFTSEPFLSGEILFGNRFDTIITFGQSLPIFVDDYIKYIGATKATRDTGLNIARFNNTLALTQSAAGALQSTATKNTNWAIGAASGVIGAFGRFFTEPARINAQLADTRNALSVSMVGGDVIDTIAGTYIYQYVWNGGGTLVQYKIPTYGTIKALNNVLYWYGNYLPQTSNLLWFTVNDDFNYYEFDADYLQNIFSNTYLKAATHAIQRDYMNVVFQHLVNGIRLYNEIPDTRELVEGE